MTKDTTPDSGYSLTSDQSSSPYATKFGNVWNHLKRGLAVPALGLAALVGAGMVPNTASAQDVTNAMRNQQAVYQSVDAPGSYQNNHSQNDAVTIHVDEYNGHNAETSTLGGIINNAQAQLRARGHEIPRLRVNDAEGPGGIHEDALPVVEYLAEHNPGIIRIKNDALGNLYDISLDAYEDVTVALDAFEEAGLDVKPAESNYNKGVAPVVAQNPAPVTENGVTPASEDLGAPKDADGWYMYGVDDVKSAPKQATAPVIPEATKTESEPAGYQAPVEPVIPVTDMAQNTSLVASASDLDDLLSTIKFATADARMESYVYKGEKGGRKDLIGSRISDEPQEFDVIMDDAGLIGKMYEDLVDARVFAEEAQEVLCAQRTRNPRVVHELYEEKMESASKQLGKYGFEKHMAHAARELVQLDQKNIETADIQKILEILNGARLEVVADYGLNVDNVALPNTRLARDLFELVNPLSEVEPEAYEGGTKAFLKGTGNFLASPFIGLYEDVTNVHPVEDAHWGWDFLFYPLNIATDIPQVVNMEREWNDMLSNHFIENVAGLERVLEGKQFYEDTDAGMTYFIEDPEGTIGTKAMLDRVVAHLQNENVRKLQRHDPSVDFNYRTGDVAFGIETGRVSADGERYDLPGTGWIELTNNAELNKAAFKAFVKTSATAAGIAGGAVGGGASGGAAGGTRGPGGSAF